MGAYQEEIELRGKQVCLMAIARKSTEARLGLFKVIPVARKLPSRATLLAPVVSQATSTTASAVDNHPSPVAPGYRW